MFTFTGEYYRKLFVLDTGVVRPMPVPGQRLSLFGEVWKAVGADLALQTLVKDGHKIVFEEGPPPCTQPNPEFETNLLNDKMEVIRAEISQLLEKGAIRRVSAKEARDVPGFYSQIFAVPKPNGKWRVVINLKAQALE